MLQITNEDPDSRTIEILIDGKVTRGAMQELSNELRTKAQMWGKINILERYVSLDGVEPSAVWEDIKLYFKNVKNFNKIALVTDKSLVRTFTKVLAPFFNLEVKVFTNDEIQQARHWLAI